MKKLHIAINGFGRIGRCVTRLLTTAGASRSAAGMRLVGINSRAPAAVAAHLLKYDSTHGAFAADVSHEDDALIINGVKIPYSREGGQGELSALPWRALAADIVLECSGKFNSAKYAAQHIRAGARKVLFSAPATEADLTVVYGVNHQKISAAMTAVSNASCTTNCLAPIVQVLHGCAGITAGVMSTVHAYTSDQQLLDNSHKDPRRARAAALSIVPAKTGAAAAIGLVIPALAGKIRGAALRVPVANVSLVELSACVRTPLSAARINDAMRAAAAGELRGVLGISEAPLVSCDFGGRSESAIFDPTLTQADEGSPLVKISAWYDNEWGFSHRLLDTAAAMAAAG